MKNDWSRAAASTYFVASPNKNCQNDDATPDIIETTTSFAIVEWRRGTRRAEDMFVCLFSLFASLSLSFSRGKRWMIVRPNSHDGDDVSVEAGDIFNRCDGEGRE